MVPWRACLWFRRNLGSVPLREGYLEVLGFLMLRGGVSETGTFLREISWKIERPTRYGEPCGSGCAETSSLTLDDFGKKKKLKNISFCVAKDYIDRISGVEAGKNTHWPLLLWFDDACPV